MTTTILLLSSRLSCTSLCTKISKEVKFWCKVLLIISILIKPNAAMKENLNHSYIAAI